MLDIHTHILPKMDDGSQSVRRSIAMLRSETKQGVGRVVLTPHYYADREAPDEFLKRRSAAFGLLTAATNGGEKFPALCCGAEVAFFRGMSRIDGIEALCIEKTNAMLIEMPFCRWNGSILEELKLLSVSRGIRPVIAHVERYIRYQPLGMMRGLMEAGCLLQANTSFFTGWQTSLLAMRMLSKQKIHFIGSDCHDTKRRPPNMSEAVGSIEKRLGKQAVDFLEHMENMLMEGD